MILKCWVDAWNINFLQEFNFSFLRGNLDRWVLNSSILWVFNGINKNRTSKNSWMTTASEVMIYGGLYVNGSKLHGPSAAASNIVWDRVSSDTNMANMDGIESPSK